MSLESKNLSRHSEVTVRYVTCCAAHHEPGEIEYSERDVLVLPLKGSFVKHLGAREQLVATPSSAVFFARSRPYRVSHPCRLQDECVALEFNSELIRSVLTEVAGVDDFSSRRLRAHATLDLPFTLARNLLVGRLRSGFADMLEITETGLALLAATVRGACDDKRNERTRRETEARRREQVERAQLALLAAETTPPSLAELAVLAQTTPYHLARIFRRHTGVPVHEYSARLRLARSLSDLLDTDRNVTCIALDHGFSSHSHYTYAFRRRTGTTPSELRRAVRTGSSRQTRKILTALPDISR